MKALVLDTSVLSPFARAGRLDELDRLTSGHDRLTTNLVMVELKEGAERFPLLSKVETLSWLSVVAVASAMELELFGEYTRLLGGREMRNLGEASVLAHAEAKGCTALCDDEIAVKIARRRRVEVKRSLALFIGGVKSGMLGEEDACRLVDELVEMGQARYPCCGSELLGWARLKGML